MMQRINLAIALHFHQPTGNFGHIFERAYKFCYRPFLERLLSYPDIKMMFHISGCLFDFLEEKHPDTMSLIDSMVKRNQIEIMGGGYYEPILTAIPSKDVMGQIEMMSDYVEKRFKIAARGMWIAERVWDPGLAEVLYKSGMRYLVLDDEHLLRSGVKEKDIHGYFLTGKDKKKIAVFPSNKTLRYLIPFRPVQELVDYLKGISVDTEDVLLTYGDDGEKFGEWPGTYTHVYGNRWLDNFFAMLLENREWIELVHFSEYMKRYSPQADLRINQGSYKEMMEWSGNSWSNFLSKYPESNQMHKKMLYVSSKLESEKRKKGVNIKAIEKAQKYLYKGQCNCAYWHGVFGGLYLYHLRKGIYDHLIEADKIIDNILHKSDKRWIEIRKFDFDLDGKEEVVIENRDFFIYVDPQRGGVIKELDYRPLSFNLVNTLSRRREPYHKKILKSAVMQEGDSGLVTIHDDFRKFDPSFKGKFIYDKFDRCFLRTFFLQDVSNIDDLINSSYKEIGKFSNLNYRVDIENRGVTLRGLSTIKQSTVRLSKGIRIESRNEIDFTFNIRREKAFRHNLLFGLEFNIVMPELNSERYFYRADTQKQGDLNSRGYVSRASSFGISDARNEFGISFCFSEKPGHIFYFPVETVSQSERSYDLNYQCSCIFGLWEINPRTDSEYSFNVRLVFERGRYGPA
ncbi:MAG: DUF1926 domain-containing protein [Candidatus Omnitrophica bacterium]|nr:DUF1926 domain-containing protein [Candidatus Omnitrophota bacterium]